MSKGRPTEPSKCSAFIALAGLTASAAVWFGHAYVDGVLFAGDTLTSALVQPEAHVLWSRLVVIVLVLVATLLAQVLSARRAQLEMAFRCERELAAATLRDSQQRYRLLVNNCPDMIAISADGRVVFVNPAGIRLLGLPSADDAYGLPVSELFEPNGSGLSPESFADVLERGAFDRTLLAVLRRPDGTPVDVELTGNRLMLSGEPVVQFVAHDITERLRAEATIRRMAYYDSLTQLPNRSLFKDRLGAALALARRTGSQIGLIFLDLDEFKAINDTLGHAIGDTLLRMVGTRLRAVVREEDTVARLCGDEFAIVAHLSSADEAEALADRLLHELSLPFEIQRRVLHVTACLGIAIFPHDGDEATTMLRHADTAMYWAKKVGHNTQRRYHPEMGEEAAENLEFEMRLRQALALKEFEMHYQPQVDLRTGRVMGIEALLRWNHPERGLLPAEEFIDVAERTGVIVPMGQWIIKEACQQACEWRAKGVEFDRVTVNLSAREIMQQDVADIVFEGLRSTGLPPEDLEIEISESTALRGVEKVLEAVERLRSLGVRIAIDDFGTGYSSLSHLKRFPIQTLKIAQDFMQEVPENEYAAAIARMVIELGKLLDYDIVAEGVESEEQLEFLSSHGCHIIQGFIFSQPVPADEIPVLLEGQKPSVLMVRQCTPKAS